jgi:hypothetical protein
MELYLKNKKGVGKFGNHAFFCFYLIGTILLESFHETEERKKIEYG